MKKIPPRTIERFFRYSQFLHAKLDVGAANVFSHELALAVSISPEQVRRDLMSLKVRGTPQKGYPINSFLTELYRQLGSAELTKIVLVGVGNLGKAVITYFEHRRPNLSIVAAFDSDPKKINATYAGCKVYHINKLKEVITQEKPFVGIITVPASCAQQIADEMADAGIKGVLNFAPCLVKPAKGVFLEQLDITMSLEKTAYFAKRMASKGVIKNEC